MANDLNQMLVDEKNTTQDEFLWENFSAKIFCEKMLLFSNIKLDAI
jgi:hypothetical protein